MCICASVLAAILPACQLVSESVDCRLTMADPTNSLARFVVYPPRTSLFGASPSFQVNPSFWAKDVDLSCASPWNSASGVLRAGTLVSKRHVVFAQHFALWPGVRIAFVDGEGQACVCSIKKIKAIPQSDISVGLLDYEVTPNIRPAKILPEDFRKHLGDAAGLPTATFDKEERLVVADLMAFPTNAEWRIGKALKPDNARRLAFNRMLRSGDSGNPAFLIVGNTPVLLYTLHGGRYGSGSAIHSFRREVQSAMDELCPGYKLECVDFEKAMTK